MAFKVQIYKNSNLFYNIKVNCNRGTRIFKQIYRIYNNNNNNSISTVVLGCAYVVPAYLNNFNHMI